ncbi:hypothetical protein HMPREF9233_00927 [Actinobaculum massiliense ACS-171-V-Col2]|uniref:Uncharacterized protein n=1 Tax=Actinobaculum massiliense ACS-171-V-Col2 TaxID=883066 RepID=K9EGX5_9ACTO|nr:hypothetical protein HMPREF9233_00927 [Actinobaculum massiliense ACS-171-V-Col2]
MRRRAFLALLPRTRAIAAYLLLGNFLTESSGKILFVLL